MSEAYIIQAEDESYFRYDKEIADFNNVMPPRRVGKKEASVFDERVADYLAQKFCGMVIANDGSEIVVSDYTRRDDRRLRRRSSFMTRDLVNKANFDDA